MSVQPPTIQLLHKGRFIEIPCASATPIGSNAWTLSIHKGPELDAILRKSATLEMFDDAIFLIGDIETDKSIGSKETSALFQVTSWTL